MLKELLLYMCKRLNGYNFEENENVTHFDFEFKDYVFTFDLKNNTIKLNDTVENLNDGYFGLFREISHEEITKEEVLEEITKVKKAIRHFAKQHKGLIFINRVEPLRNMINNLFFQLKMQDIQLYNELSQKQDKFNKFVDNCLECCKEV